MNEKRYQYIQNKLSLEIEIWDFNNDDTRIVDPTLPNGDYRFGIAVYLVPTGNND